MRFVIVGKPELEKSVEVVKEVYNYLKSRADVTFDLHTAKKLKLDGVPLEKIDTDIIITVGGDGTVLRTLQNAKGKIFSINVGKVGFLTETIPVDLERCMDRLLSGDYTIDSRTKIKVMLNDKRLLDCTNEVVLHTVDIAKIRSYAIYVNDELAEDLRADGIIIATPTGSTSYALSAGGPIIDPRLDAFEITHIAPFKLGARSHIVSSSAIIDVHLLDLNKSSLLVLDGQKQIVVSDKDKIRLTVSENRAEFIRFSRDYFRKFREKMI